MEISFDNSKLKYVTHLSLDILSSLLNTSLKIVANGIILLFVFQIPGTIVVDHQLAQIFQYSLCIHNVIIVSCLFCRCKDSDFSAKHHNKATGLLIYSMEMGTTRVPLNVISRLLFHLNL